MVHDMNSKTDYRKLAHHHRGLYFVTPSREEVSCCLETCFLKGQTSRSCSCGRAARGGGWLRLRCRGAWHVLTIKCTLPAGRRTCMSVPSS